MEKYNLSHIDYFKDKTVLIFDTEMMASIAYEFGGLVFKNGELDEEFEYFLKPTKRIVDLVDKKGQMPDTLTNHIKYPMWMKKGLDIKAFVDVMDKYIQDCDIMILYNAVGDLKAMEVIFKMVSKQITWRDKTLLDPFWIVRDKLRERNLVERSKLEDILRYYKKNFSKYKLHSAIYDAEMLVILMEEFEELVVSDGGTLHDYEGNMIKDKKRFANFIRYATRKNAFYKDIEGNWEKRWKPEGYSEEVEERKTRYVSDLSTVRDIETPEYDKIIGDGE